MYFYWRKFTGTGNGAAEPMNMVRRILIPEQPFRERRPGAAWPEWGVWPAKWIAPAEGEAAGMRATLFRCDIEMERQETVRLHLAADAVYRPETPLLIIVEWTGTIPFSIRSTGRPERERTG